MRCSGEISGTPGDRSLTATMSGNMGNSTKARGPVESMAGGQAAGAGSMLSYSRSPRPSGTQRREDADSASISSSGEDRHGCG